MDTKMTCDCEPGIEECADYRAGRIDAERGAPCNPGTFRGLRGAERERAEYIRGYEDARAEADERKAAEDAASVYGEDGGDE